jgi:8-oxo-dGTP diphosphatase
MFISKSKRSYVAIEYSGEVFMVQNWLSDGSWQFPGGGVEKGETISAAAVREIGEELGLRIVESDLEFLHTTTGKFGFESHVFLCRLLQKPSINLQRSEIVGSGWFTAVPEQTNADIKSSFGAAIAKLV